MIDQIKIGGLCYSVTLQADLKRPNENTQLYGYIDHLDTSIQVEEKMVLPVQQIALMHEVLHGIIHQAGIFSNDEESLVIAISHGLRSLIRDNPHLIDYLRS